jgi:acid phosphatase
MKRIIGLIATALMLAVCSAPAQAAAPFPAHAFDRIFVIIFENKTPAQVLSQPYFGEIAKRGVLLKNYRAVAKPSQPNYIAMLAGNTLVRTNASYNLPQRNLVDLMEEAGVSWKAYMEAYPGKCFAGGSYKGLYARKHNPFISFNSVRNDPLRCAKVVNADQLEADIAGGALPRFSFYVPDMNNSGHDKPVSHADAWLRSSCEARCW